MGQRAKVPKGGGPFLEKKAPGTAGSYKARRGGRGKQGVQGGEGVIYGKRVTFSASQGGIQQSCHGASGLPLRWSGTAGFYRKIGNSGNSETGGDKKAQREGGRVALQRELFRTPMRKSATGKGSEGRKENQRRACVKRGLHFLRQGASVRKKEDPGGTKKGNG